MPRRPIVSALLVVPVADLIPRAEEILNQIFKNAPIAVKYSLEAVNKGLETNVA